VALHAAGGQRVGVAHGIQAIDDLGEIVNVAAVKGDRPEDIVQRVGRVLNDELIGAGAAGNRCGGSGRRAANSENVLDAAALAAAAVDIERCHTEIVDGLRGVAQRRTDSTPRVAQHLGRRDVVPFATAGALVVNVHGNVPARAVDGD